MSRLAVKPSLAVAQLLRDRRRELGLTLRQVQKQTGAMGELIPFTTLAKVERGKVDPGLKRLHLLLRLYHLPTTLAGDLLDLEELAEDSQKDAAPSTLYEEGVRLWKSGDTRQALGTLFALRARIPDEPHARVERQRALLGFAIMAGSLGKYRLSREIIDGLLLEVPDGSLLVQVLIQAAVCWHWLGSDEAALAFLARAETHLTAADVRQRAWIYHERASTLASMREFTSARVALETALGAYRAAADVYGESRALGVRVRLELAERNLPRALEAARAARDHAQHNQFARLAVMRGIDEATALLGLGQREPGLAALNDALASAVVAGDSVTRFYVHHALWKAHEADSPRAALELKSAQYYVRFVDESTPEAVEVRKTLSAAGKAAALPPDVGYK